MTNGEGMKQVEMAQNGRGTACHLRGTPCHEIRNPLKNNKKKAVSKITAQNAEKVFVYKDFEATGSLLRQVCCFLRGMGVIEMQARSLHPLADGCGCDLRHSRFRLRPGSCSVNRPLPPAPTKTPAGRITILNQLLLSLAMVAPCPALAETWQIASASAWQSGSSFERAEGRAKPGPGSSFSNAKEGSTFELRTPAKTPSKPFVLPEDRDEFVRLRALINHAESRGLGYDDYHGSGGAVRMPPPKRPREMTIREIFTWVENTPNQQHAIGRYQFIPSTLASLVRRTGLPVDTTFDERIQDTLANVLILDAGYVEFKAGQKVLGAYMDDLARIWAGFPLATGLSAHHGKAGNRATVSRSFFEEQMARIFPAEAARDGLAIRVAER